MAPSRRPKVSRAVIRKAVKLLEDGRTSFDLELWESFEADLARYFGVPQALLCCNGTAAAHSAFFALGLGPGDEVIAPPYTHWATVIPATLLGCNIVFADTAPDSLSLTVESVRARITPATRAVVVCHLYGNPVDVAGLRALCDEHGLSLLEDISHAPGATVHGRRVGSFGDAAFMSFQAKKVVSGGEGGALLVKEFDAYARAMEFGQPNRLFRLPPEYRAYNPVGRGYKYRLSPLLALLAYESFKGLERHNAARTAAAGVLRAALAEVPDVCFPAEAPGAQRTFLKCEFFVKRGGSAEAVARLRAAGLPADPANFPILPDLPHFRGTEAAAASVPNARRLAAQLVLVDPPETAVRRTAARYARALRTR